MKKLDRKGFTLIELLAVIVILAIIMVIAVPQILNVIENSRSSAWKSNVKMIADGIELGKTMTSSGLATKDFDIDKVCTAASSDSINESLRAVADVSDEDTTVTCAGKGSVTVTGKGQFSGQKVATIACTNGSCKITYAK